MKEKINALFLCLILSACSINTSDKENNKSVDGGISDIVENNNQSKPTEFEVIDGKLFYGKYPQTLVQNSELSDELSLEAGALPTNENQQKWTPYDWYIENDNSVKFSWFIDLDIDNDCNNDYRGVYFTASRPMYLSLTSEHSNQRVNGYVPNTIYWFKFESIEWRVLSNYSRDYFIMTNKIIDSTHYHETSNNYLNSHLRKFLNNDFYNFAFNSSEKDRIQITNVDNSSSSTGDSTNQYWCENTNDKVFALSHSEITNPTFGFSNNGDFYIDDPTRKLETTDYADCMGCNIDENCGCGCWSLRSPDPEYSFGVLDVAFDGAVDIDGAEETNVGVVPAMHIQ